MNDSEIGITLPYTEGEAYPMCDCANRSQWCIDHLELGVTWNVTHPQPFCCRLGHELGLCTHVNHITSDFFSNCDVDILHTIFVWIPSYFAIAPHSPTNPNCIISAPCSFFCASFSFHSRRIAPRLLSSAHLLYKCDTPHM